MMNSRVTVMKDKVSRKSKGVAFVLFLNREDALQCVKSVDGLEVIFNKAFFDTSY